LRGLRQTDERMRQLTQAVEQSSNGVVITDLQGRIEYINFRRGGGGGLYGGGDAGP
jgi:PAS domain-containing protein